MTTCHVSAGETVFLTCQPTDGTADRKIGVQTMTKSLFGGFLLILTAAPAQVQAQSPAAPVPGPTIAAPPSNEEVRWPRPPRARGFPTALAAEAALEAISVCKADGYKVNALVTDSGGVPIALLSGEGAAAITQRIAMSKAQSVIKYHMTSGEVTAKAAADATVMAQLLADPMIGTPRQGAIPVMIGTDLAGAIPVSGAPSGDKDEPCALAALNKIKSRLN
jgi:uncharacterized protein GlcG (DUF336 family)